VLDKLKVSITEKQRLSENKCGTTVTSLMQEFNLNSTEIKVLLNQLHVEKFVRIRQGINNKLIFLR
jgi:predicted transcriptional regulator